MKADIKHQTLKIAGRTIKFNSLINLKNLKLKPKIKNQCLSKIKVLVKVLKIQQQKTIRKISWSR